MAQIEKIIPFLIYWESGVRHASEDLRTLFEKARAKGIVCDPDDRGGATVAGVTMTTFADYRRRKGLPAPFAADLAGISYAEWLDVLKTLFWNRWQADRIDSQRVAHMLVDWVWTSGSYGITIPQRVLGVKADGIVGKKTVAAVNDSNPANLFALLKRERMAYIDRICRSRSANLRFRNGWLRRINAI